MRPGSSTPLSKVGRFAIEPEEVEEQSLSTRKPTLRQKPTMTVARITRGIGTLRKKRCTSNNDIAALGSAPSDHPLKEIADGQRRGQLPVNDILTAILTAGESDVKDLTNRVFWQKYPDLSGKMLDPEEI